MKDKGTYILGMDRIQVSHDLYPTPILHLMGQVWAAMK